MLCVPLSALLPAQVPLHWLDDLVEATTRLAPAGSFFAFSFNIRALLALVLVSLCCGAIGSLVVGGRLAFFSDALAHCSFAGISIGFLLFLLTNSRDDKSFWDWVTMVMVVFGVLAGCGIVWVRARTGLSSDTVIGVFFAGAVGLAAALRRPHPQPQSLQSRRLPVRQSRRGDGVASADPGVFDDLHRRPVGVDLQSSAAGQLQQQPRPVAPRAGANGQLPVHHPLGSDRQLVSALCRRLLINALLIIPAATAINLSRNMRQLFWLTIVLTLLLSVGGQWLSWELGAGAKIPLGISGTIVLLSVTAFILSMILGPWIRSRRTA